MNTQQAIRLWLLPGAALLLLGPGNVPSVCAATGDRTAQTEEQYFMQNAPDRPVPVLPSFGEDAATVPGTAEESGSAQVPHADNALPLQGETDGVHPEAGTGLDGTRLDETGLPNFGETADLPGQKGEARRDADTRTADTELPNFGEPVAPTPEKSAHPGRSGKARERGLADRDRTDTSRDGQKKAGQKKTGQKKTGADARDDKGPLADRDKARERDSRQGASKSGNRAAGALGKGELDIPEGAASAKDLRFLSGCWRSLDPLVRHGTNERIEMEYCFDEQGNGQRIIHEGNQQCTGPAQARFQGLSLQLDAPALSCPDGQGYSAQAVECNEADGKTLCRGRDTKPDGSTNLWDAHFARSK